MHRYRYRYAKKKVWEPLIQTREYNISFFVSAMTGGGGPIINGLVLCSGNLLPRVSQNVVFFLFTAKVTSLNFEQRSIIV